MNKRELIDAVAAQVGSDQAQARRHVDAVFETIMNSVVAPRFSVGRTFKESV